MRRLLCVPILALAVASSAFAAPPEVPPSLTVGAGKVAEIVVKAPAGKEIGYKLVGGKAAFREMKPDNPAERVFWLIPDGSGPLYIVWWTQGETASVVTAVNEGAPPPGPTPVPPGPKPPDPVPPGPVTSFRVFLVYESGDSLTAAQRAVVYGKQVEEWLNANCTGGKAGWRRRDKDVPGESDPAMKGLWDAVKPHVTATPCVAVEVNGKVELIPLEPTPAAMVAKLQAYRGK